MTDYAYPQELESECHCGRDLAYGYDGDPTHTRGMCAHCDAVRCDAYPGACDRSHAPDCGWDVREGERLIACGCHAATDAEGV